MKTALGKWADVWREVADHFAQQEKDWRDTKLFCLQKRREIVAARTAKLDLK